MSLQDQPRIRKALLAGAVALALTGTGAALAWSADQSSATSPGSQALQSAPGQVNRPAKADQGQRPKHLHSEGVVKKADGTFQTVLEQRGTVEAASGTSVTVKSEDGYVQSYSVSADTKITLFPAPAADGSPPTDDDGKRLRPSDGTIADIAPGDAVRIAGVRNGDQAAAERIVEGAGDGPGLGRGGGHSGGHGKGQGRGHAK